MTVNVFQQTRGMADVIEPHASRMKWLLKSMFVGNG